MVRCGFLAVHPESSSAVVVVIVVVGVMGSAGS
jgi:hypothetical protein